MPHTLSPSFSLSRMVKDLKAVPQGVWGVGLSNLCINLATIFVFSLFSIFLVEEMGANPGLVGFWDGLMQAFALSIRVFSGFVSDFLRKRRLLLLIGYSCAALSKPILALAPSIPLFMLGHSLDRFGNGLQASPRDALIGDITPSHLKGECYGLRQSLAIIGSLLGPIIAIPLMHYTNNDYRAVFMISMIPALLAIGVLFWMVKEPKLPALPPSKRHLFRFNDVIHLSKGYWLVIGLSCVFTLARFGESFLILRGKGLGLMPQLIPTVMIVMNLFNSLAAYPFGRFSDYYDRRILLALSFIILILSDLFLGLSTGLVGAFIGIALWGVQLGAVTSLIQAMVADTARPDLRATAFGVYYLTNGLVYILAGLWAGLVWEHISPNAMFLGGAVIASIATLGIFLLPAFKPKAIVAK